MSDKYARAGITRRKYLCSIFLSIDLLVLEHMAAEESVIRNAKLCLQAAEERTGPVTVWVKQILYKQYLVCRTLSTVA